MHDLRNVSYILSYPILKTRHFNSTNFCVLYFVCVHFSLNADAKVPNLQGITVEKIFGPSSVESGMNLGELLVNDRDPKNATPEKGKNKTFFNCSLVGLSISKTLYDVYSILILCVHLSHLEQ